MTSSPKSAGVSAEELVQRTEWVMRRNERILREKGCTDADFYFGKGEGSLLYQWTTKNVASWFNYGALKEFLFSMVRNAVEAGGYDCVIFASDTFRFQANELYLKLPEDERHRLTDRGFKKLVSLGYGETVEAVCVVGQTPQHAFIISKAYFRDVLDPDKVFRIGPEIRSPIMTIDEYAGRSKMFGDWREPGMAEAFKAVTKAIAKTGKNAAAELADSSTLVNIAVDEP